MSAANRLERLFSSIWRKRGPLAVLLLPLAALFAIATSIRRSLFRAGILSSGKIGVPVIVVGNVTVGGSGKTPVAIWLVEYLRARGRRPGVVSRGYGRSSSGIAEICRDTPAESAGDEPLLIARRASCPVFVGGDRVAAARALLATHPACDVIISDDGLQHYRLARNLEIVVFDSRGVGNGWLLPAGPLREPVSRVDSAHMVIANGELPASLRERFDGQHLFSMSLQGTRFFHVGSKKIVGADSLRGRRLHAVAGIGYPQRFFAQLRALGLEFAEHAFADHHAYCARDLAFEGAEAILMTEKDAVKCEPFAHQIAAEMWVLRVDAQISPDPQPLIDLLLETQHGSAPA